MNVSQGRGVTDVPVISSKDQGSCRVTGYTMKCVVSGQAAAYHVCTAKVFEIFSVLELYTEEDDEESWNTGYACEGSELQIRCAEGTFIHVINANYGRLDPGICADDQQSAQSQDWNLRCVTKDSLAIVRARSCIDQIHFTR